MQISLKSAVIAALAVGGAMAAATANAGTVNIALPNTGNSSLLFWVNDVSNGTTYTQALTIPQAQVTGAGGLFTYVAGSGSISAVTTYTGSSSFQVNDSGDTALVNFISTALAAGQTLTWGITAGAQAAPATTAGHSIAIATVPLGDSQIVGLNKSTLTGGMLSNATGLGFDIGLLQGQTADSFNGTTTGIIGTPQSESGTNTTFYGAVAQNGLALGATSNLYAITNPAAALSSTKTVSFNLGTVTFSSSTDILSFTANGASAPVPLPAAVWLLGSGLLGLAGVGRRRAAKTETV